MGTIKNLVETLPRGFVLLVALAIVNILLAFVREVAIAFYFGASADVDAFMVAVALPRILVGTAASVSVAVVLPVYVGYREGGRLAEAAALISGWMRFLLVTSGASGVCILVFAPSITRLLAPGMPAASQQLAGSWLRWLSLYLLAGVVGGGVKIVLDAHQRFAWPQLAPALVSLCVVVSAYFLHEELGLTALAFGFIVGGVLGLVLQWRRAAGIEVGVFGGVQPAGVSLPLAAAGIVLLQEGARQLNPLIDRFFASTLAPGSIAALNYAEALNTLPNTVISATLATALFPVLARMAASGEMSRAMAVTRRWVVVFAVAGLIPAILLVVFRHEVVSLAFERGEFDATATSLTASVLTVLPAMIIFSAVSTLLVRLLLVQQRQRTILVLTVLAIAIKLVLSALWVGRWGLVGLVSATVVAAFLATIARFVIANRTTSALGYELGRTGGDDFGGPQGE